MSDITLEFNSDFFAAQLNDKIQKASRSATDTTSTWAAKKLEQLVKADNPDFKPRFIRNVRDIKGRVMAKRSRPGRNYASIFAGKKQAGIGVLKGRIEDDRPAGGVWVGNLFFERAFLITFRNGRQRLFHRVGSRLETPKVNLINIDQNMSSINAQIGPELQRRFNEKMAAD